MDMALIQNGFFEVVQSDFPGVTDSCPKDLESVMNRDPALHS